MSKIAAPDLLLRRGDEPIIVVEAKSLPVQGDFREPVRIQMQDFARRTHSPWALLIDPILARLYRSPDIVVPCVEIPSHEIVEAGGYADAPVVGSSVLTGATERWLRGLPQQHAFLKRYPALTDLAAALTEDDDLIAERSYD